jgi:hypothetical protein
LSSNSGDHDPFILQHPGDSRPCNQPVDDLRPGREVCAHVDLESKRLVRLFDTAVPAEYSYWAVWNGSSPKRRRIEAFVNWAAGLFEATPLEPVP